jgi:hypothetical protein
MVKADFIPFGRIEKCQAFFFLNFVQLLTMRDAWFCSRYGTRRTR